MGGSRTLSTDHRLGLLLLCPSRQAGSMNSSSQPNYSDTPPAADGARTVRLVPAAGQSTGQSIGQYSGDSAGLPTAMLPGSSLPGNKHAWRTRQLNEMGLNAASIAALVRARVLI